MSAHDVVIMSYAGAIVLAICTEFWTLGWFAIIGLIIHYSFRAIGETTK